MAQNVAQIPAGRVRQQALAGRIDAAADGPLPGSELEDVLQFADGFRSSRVGEGRVYE